MDQLIERSSNNKLTDWTEVVYLFYFVLYFSFANKKQSETLLK